MRPISRLRGYYFQCAPELVGHLLSVRPSERLMIQGLPAGRWQKFFTVAGMVGVVTAVLAGSAAGLLAAIVSNDSVAAALTAGVLVAVAVLLCLLRYEASAAEQASAMPLFADEEARPR